MRLTMFFAILLLAASCQQKPKSDSMTNSEFVPPWAKHAVWYQVFPERFRNGDPTNDPILKDIKGADPQELPGFFQIHPWTSDWYKLQPWEKKNGDSEMWKHLLRRRYGGDLQGVLDKLGYIKDLGINAIYLNPVFDSPSLHKYDGNSYHHIDPNFGPDPEGDRKLMATENPIDPETWVWTKADLLALELIEKAHEVGIRIIFDGVFNHMGINSFAFQDVIKYQQDSPYKDWFIIHSWDDKEAGTKFDYEGWFGVKSLPELREDENGIVSGPKEYIFAATKRWMNPMNKGTQFGIDGWRLDVAFCVDHAFWKNWRTWVRSINSEAYLTAEIIDTPEKVIPYFEGDEFDAEMNYNFAFTAAEFFYENEERTILPSVFDKKLKELRNLYPPGVAYATMNLFGSHDANRIGSHIVNRGVEHYRNWGKYFGASKVTDNPKYSPRKPSPDEYELQKQFIILQMTYIGAPMVYYGDEVGMWGGNDPDCRKPMIWPDYTYEDERFNPDQTKRSPEKVEINYDLFNFYKKMIAIRNNSLELRIGEYETIFTDDEKRIFAFRRWDGTNETIVILNNSRENQTVRIPGFEGTYMEQISQTKMPFNEAIDVSVPAEFGVVLRKMD